MKDWQVGTLTAQSLNLILLPTNQIESIDGILGAAFLLDHDLEFDLKEGKVRLFKPNGCAGDQVVYWGQAYSVVPMAPMGDYGGVAVFVPVQVNGLTVRAMIDSGSTRSVIDTGTAARAGLKVADASVEKGYGIGAKALEAQVGHFDAFGFGDEVIHNSQLRIADIFGAAKVQTTGTRFSQSVSSVEPQMLLGYDFLRAHRVYIAMSQHKVYVSYEGGPVFDTSKPPPPATTAPAK